MLIETQNENGGYQYWELVYESNYLYINQRSPREIEREIERELNEIDLRKVHVFPLIDKSQATFYSNVRGYKDDPAPFKVRGRALGQIMVHVFKNSLGIQMYPAHYSSFYDWNFTDKQKQFIKDLYFPTILAELTPENLAIARNDAVYRTVNSLKSQIAREREDLDLIESFITTETINALKNEHIVV